MNHKMGNTDSATLETGMRDELENELESKYSQLYLEYAQKMTTLEGDVASCESKNTELTKDRNDKQSQLTAMTKDRDDKQSQLTAKTNELNTTKTNADDCKKNLNKLIAAHRRLRADGYYFKKLLFDNYHWSMYIVDNWDSFKQHKWYKYLWNIAIVFKNTWHVICIYCSTDTVLHPGSQQYNFKAINEGFLRAIEFDTKLTAYNIKEVITNPFLAKKVTVKFWGAYKQKPSDTGYPIDALLGHETTSSRHSNLNQTSWMWNWMQNTVAKLQSTKNDLSAFENRGRIVKTVSTTANNYNEGLKTVSMDGAYVRRPDLPL